MLIKLKTSSTTLGKVETILVNTDHIIIIQPTSLGSYLTLRDYPIKIFITETVDDLLNLIQSPKTIPFPDGNFIFERHKRDK